MSDNAASQLRRLLQVIPRLADGAEHPIAELAADAGVALGTLLEDLASITERFDAPGGFVEGVQVTVSERTVSIVSNHFLRPMRLTMAELCALELGLSVLRRERPPEEQAAIERALERLRGVITRLPANEAYAGLRVAELPVPGYAQTSLATIRQAMRARERVRLVYRRGGDADATARVIAPYSLAFANGAWFVVAYCSRSEGIRVFRVDRIEAATATGERFELPEDFSVDALVAEGRILTGDTGNAMTVRYGPRVARWIAEREGLALAADGSLTMRHPLLDREWAVRHVLQYGKDAEVVEPAEVRQRVAARLEEMAR